MLRFSYDSPGNNGGQYNASSNLCSYFLNGGCTMGRFCRFIHDFSRLKRQNPFITHTAGAYRARDTHPATEHGYHPPRDTHPATEHGYQPPRDTHSATEHGYHPSAGFAGGQYNTETKLCGDYLNGGCAMGRTCRFYHDFSRLKRRKSSTPRTAQPYSTALTEHMNYTPTDFVGNNPPRTQSELRWCMNCKLDKQLSYFSKTQARRAGNKRKCMDCVKISEPQSSKKLRTSAEATDKLNTTTYNPLVAGFSFSATSGSTVSSSNDNPFVGDSGSTSGGVPSAFPLTAPTTSTAPSEINPVVTNPTAMSTDVEDGANPTAMSTDVGDGGLCDDASDSDKDNELPEDPPRVIIVTNDGVEIHTTREILRNSRYFEALLSQRWGGEGLMRLQVDRPACIVKYLLVLLSSDLSAVDIPSGLEKQVLSDCDYYQIDPVAKDISEMEMSKAGTCVSKQDAINTVHAYENRLATAVDNMSENHIKRAAVKLIKIFGGLIDRQSKCGKNSVTLYIKVYLGERYEPVEDRLRPYVKAEMERRGYELLINPYSPGYEVRW